MLSSRRQPELYIRVACAFVGLFAVATALVLASSAAAAPAPVELSFLGSETLEVEAEEGESFAEAYVTLFNAGERPTSFAITLQASSSAEVEISETSPSSVGAAGAERVKLVFSGVDSLEEKLDGQLVMTGGTGPVSLPVAITPAPQPSAPWLEIIVVGAAALTLVLMLVIVGVIPVSKRGLLKKRAVGPKWSFDSWAGVLTTIGAVFGSVLGGVTLPDVPSEIGKDTLIGLNLLFPALLAVAPFVFYAIRPRALSAADQEAGLAGFNVVLLFACCLTCGAVVGELATLGLLGWELLGESGWAWAASALLVVLAGLAIYYCSVTAYSLATTDWEAQQTEADEAAPPAILMTRARVSPAPESRQGELQIVVEPPRRRARRPSLP